MTARNVRLSVGGRSVEAHLETLSIADRAFALTQGQKKSEFQRPFRQWLSADGKYKVSAKAIVADGQTLRLKRVDDKLIGVPLTKLSDTDQLFIERLQKIIAPPAVDVDGPFGTVGARP